MAGSVGATADEAIGAPEDAAGEEAPMSKTLSKKAKQKARKKAGAGEATEVAEIVPSAAAVDAPEAAEGAQGAGNFFSDRLRAGRGIKRKLTSQQQIFQRDSQVGF